MKKKAFKNKLIYYKDLVWGFWMDYGGFIILLFFVILLLGCILMYDKQLCMQKTSGMGMDVDWSVIGECKVKLEDIWVPLENIRFISK